MDSAMADTEPQAWYLKSSFPVFWPACEALTLSEGEFEEYLVKIRNHGLDGTSKSEASEKASDEAIVDPGHADDDTFTLVSEQPSTTADIREMLGQMDVDVKTASKNVPTSGAVDSSDNEGHVRVEDTTRQDAFMTGLLAHGEPKEDDGTPDLATENLMLTENDGVAYRSTNSALVDLFSELEEVVSGPRLRELLNAAWDEDALATLKLIFNARSIHLGKSSRHTFYRCAGWMATYHPLTLVKNLEWLSRPVIEKKVVQKDAEKVQDDEDLVVVEDESDRARFDVRHGVAHGYWKDLLNLLALSANGDLSVLSTPREILNIENEKAPTVRSKADKRAERKRRHDDAVAAFTTNPVHHALHLKIARLFAAQLRTDLTLLESEDEKKKKKKDGISLCAKWAPSLERFHDKHTFVATSIAEIMFPLASFPPLLVSSREVYLRHARESYRRALSKLRARLDVVERPLTRGAFGEIRYGEVPSLAMRAYAPLFAERDADGFGNYLARVKNGKTRISGAVLMPSVLVRDALISGAGSGQVGGGIVGRKRTVRAYHRGKRVARRGRGGSGVAQGALVLAVEQRIRDMKWETLDAQWQTLVRRIKESGKLENCIAVCDVSGSMGGPTFPDGTTPLHTAVGLSLLMAEVVEPPFGGAFITFSSHPTVEKVDLRGTLREKARAMAWSKWGGSTDLVAVFERLILPMAIQNKLTQEQMVKRVFVFSDMQFDQAVTSRGMGRWGGAWNLSFERIKWSYETAGYEMPELVFWNLAGGRAGYTGFGDPTAPKPVTAEQKGVAMVSGYSQGLLKVFMDGGQFGDEDEEEEVVLVEAKDGIDIVSVEKKKKELDPVSLMRRAIGHRAYDMLMVVD
jgi:hypothetical protein